MRKSILLLFVMLFSLVANSQKDQIYATRIGMQNNKPFHDSIEFHIKETGNGYLIIDWIEDKETGKKFTDLYKIWGIKHKDNYYVHLSNARGINALKSFVKIDTAHLRQKYLPFMINCVAPINKPTSAKEAGIALGSLTVGMLVGSDAGLIFAISVKDKKGPEYWMKNDSSGAFLYVVELNSSLAPIGKRITRKRLKKLLKKNNNNQEYEFSDMKLEDAIVLINNL